MFEREIGEEKLWKELSREFHKHIKAGEEDAFIDSLELRKNRIKEHIKLVEENYDPVVGKKAFGYGKNEETDAVKEQRKKLAEIETELANLKDEWGLKSLGRGRRKEIVSERKKLTEEKKHRKLAIQILKKATYKWTPTEKEVFLNQKTRMLDSLESWKEIANKRRDHKEEQAKDYLLLKRDKRPWHARRKFRK